MFLEGIRSEYIESFYSYVTYGTLRNAAKQRGLGHSTIKNHIEELERLMGKKLVISTHNSVHLTEEGKDVFKIVGDIKKAYIPLGKLRHDFDTSGDFKKINIQAPLLFGGIFLNKVLLNLHNRNAKRKFFISPQAYYDPLLETADCGLVFDIPDLPNAQKGFTFTRLVHVKQGLYAHHNYVQHHGYPQIPEDLRDHWFIYSTTGKYSYLSNIDWLKNLIKEHRLQGRGLQDVEDRENALLSAEGIVLASNLYAASNPEIVQVLPEYTAPGYDLYFFVRKDIQEDSAILELKYEIQKYLNNATCHKPNLKVVG